MKPIFVTNIYFKSIYDFVEDSPVHRIDGA